MQYKQKRIVRWKSFFQNNEIHGTNTKNSLTVTKYRGKRNGGYIYLESIVESIKNEHVRDTTVSNARFEFTQPEDKQKLDKIINHLIIVRNSIV